MVERHADNLMQAGTEPKQSMWFERATFMCILVNAETTICGSAIQRLCNVSADDSLTR